MDRRRVEHRPVQPPLPPGPARHHSDIAVSGDTIRVQIDGSPALTASNNTYLHGKRIGLWANRSQIAVRELRVTAS